ncbi:hypothetical protein BDW75DRAFT_186750 [Aspergillus navahoensis]
MVLTRLMTLRWPVMNHFSNLFTGRLWHIYSGVFRFDLLFFRAVFFIMHLAQGVIVFGAIMRGRICSLGPPPTLLHYRLLLFRFTFVEPHTQAGLLEMGRSCRWLFQVDIGRIGVSGA